MRSVLFVVMALGLAVVGCGNNDCEDAVDKLEECGVTLPGGNPSDDDASECKASAECGAKCINDASCADIKAALSGTANSVGTCFAACPDE